MYFIHVKNNNEKVRLSHKESVRSSPDKNRKAMFDAAPSLKLFGQVCVSATLKFVKSPWSGRILFRYQSIVYSKYTIPDTNMGWNFAPSRGRRGSKATFHLDSMPRTHLTFHSWHFRRNINIFVNLHFCATRKPLSGLASAFRNTDAKNVLSFCFNSLTSVILAATVGLL